MDHRVALVSSANLVTRSFDTVGKNGVIVTSQNDVQRLARLFARLWLLSPWDMPPDSRHHPVQLRTAASKVPVLPPGHLGYRPPLDLGQRGRVSPKLPGRARHGSWAFAVELPSADGRRRTHCRSGFPTRKAAQAALARTLEAERTGLHCDEDLTVAAYLTEWLHTKADVLRPTTLARYHDHVHAELIPAFGRMLLIDLRPRHITTWSNGELARGRGRTTVYRMGATLSSALSSAHTPA